jgi:multidrug efflux pump
MTSFNLSDWALRNKSFVVYLMLVSAIAGVWAYGKLGREEDPPFTIKTMVVKTLWPGATAGDTLSQVTDRIEKKLEELPYLDFVRSYTKPGESVVFVNLKDTVSAKAVADLWYQVRKKVDDIRHTLPSGINGPFFNDEFGDTYSLVFALVTDGFTHREHGQPAIGLAVAMTTGGDVLALGRNVKDKVAELSRELPVGIGIHLVADQPHVVHEAVGEFTKSLMEAIAIVLAVSFLALGWRPGIVVAVAIPLVLAITFVLMKLAGISLQRISLGVLIIALGLLVDDAMIAVEMMITKMEEGYDRIKAATFAYTSTAFPMLTGTLVTIAGFVPVGFAQSGAGEYCFSLFAVVGISLVVSWLVAVLFTPLTGVFILPEKLEDHGKHGHGAFSQWFHKRLDLALRHSKLVLAATVGLFLLSLIGMRFVPQEFFPKSDRPELFVDLTLPQSASLQATEDVVNRVEKLLKAELDIEHWSFYIGQGAIRFYLPLDAQLANDFFAQAVVVTKGYKEREGVAARLEKAFAHDFDGLMARVTPLELGPPVGWPLKFRVSGPDATKARELAQAFAQVLGQNPNTRNINYDWNEPAKVIKVDVDQDRARALGISSQQLSNSINAILSGTRITQLRDSTYLIDIIARAVPEERAKLETLRNLAVATSGGHTVPLSQIATLSYSLEPPLIWRRQRLPTVTVQADVVPGIEATTVAGQLQKPIADFQAKLPAGYSVVLGGVIEDSANAQASIFVVFPLMLFLMITILMVQLMSFQRLALVLMTAPLALIGVAGALLVSRAPMGFVAILGVISLIGMVIRNSVILISQIDEHIAAGEHPWAAVISATEHRLRPILLTAAAAILGMIPIAPTVFWGPMAYAVMGGLIVATLLTLVFLPALYVTWFRIEPEAASHPTEAAAKLAIAA